jgi:hypothetical protein
MTLTNQTFFEADDILSIRISCEMCPSKLTLPITGLKDIPLNCPHCTAVWFQKGTAELSAFRNLIESIKTLKQRTKDASALIHFELKAQS